MTNITLNDIGIDIVVHALACIDSVCRYHGGDFGRLGWEDGLPRCDSCKAPYWRQRAMHMMNPNSAPVGTRDLNRERLGLARRALIDTGYFTADQVGDDIAPRIHEMALALKALGWIADRAGAT